MSDQKPFPILQMGAGERYNALFKKIEDGSITVLSNQELVEAARTLATRHFEQRGQDQEAAALLIHSMLLERTVKDVENTMIKIDRSNSATQRLVIILAVVALAVGFLQVIIGLLPLLHLLAR